VIVDTSVIIAILKGEPDAEQFQTALADAADQIELSAASYLEAGPNDLTICSKPSPSPSPR
jgi:uncharacterized protein with PIN domain